MRYHVAINVRVVIHTADEGGFWAEVPAIPGCATQGDTYEELLINLRDAIEACLSLDVEAPEPHEGDQLLELVL